MLAIEMNNQPLRLTRRKIKTILHDTGKYAESINLVYVNDMQPGIRRLKEGDTFIYRLGRKQVKDKETLLRIKRLVIPPAWTDVWICNSPDGHIQVTGFDVRGRKQYRYHPLWNQLRNETKFFSLYDFGKALPQMRRQLDKDLALPGLPLRKVLAAVVSLMQQTGIRVGSGVYKKMYGSFGLTTLHDNHIKINGSEMKFGFKGKKGVYHNISLRNKKLAKIVRQCRDIPGKELFQYYDEEGKRHVIESGMVNSYIKEISGGNFTSKHFRTWLGTLYALEVLLETECSDTVSATKKTIVETLDAVAGKLGNTRTVCRKYYVHPIVLEHYSNGCIDSFISTHKGLADVALLKPEEHVLLNMLGKIDKVLIGQVG